MKLSHVYILKCADGSYYVGVTSNLNKRTFQHQSGFYKDCYTYQRRPVELVYYCEFTNISFAIDTEKQIKKWSRVKKEALIQGEFKKLPNLAKKDFR